MIEEKTKVPNRSAEKREKCRLDREAAAIATIKAMRKSPSAPEPTQPTLQPTRLAGDDPAAPGVVYFAYCADRIKIGFSTDVENRIASLASNAPFPVTLLMTIPGSIDTESEFHLRFASLRSNLEWFTYDGDLMWFLFSKLCDDGNTRLLVAIAEYHADEL